MDPEVTRPHEPNAHGQGQRGAVPEMDPLASWRIVLVSPQTPENVGAVARLMKNFGCGDLVVVDPRCAIELGGAAGKLACSAVDVLERRQTVETLEQALAPTHFSVALTMQESDDRPMSFGGLVPLALLEGRPRDEHRALVLGREDRGLTNGECSFCSARWCLPTQPNAPSLNLAQATAVALAGIAEAQREQSPESCDETEADHSPLATNREIDGLIRHLEQVLEASEYERGVPQEYALRLIRRLALRSNIRRNEVRTLRGVCRRVLNAILGYERR